MNRKITKDYIESKLKDCFKILNSEVIMNKDKIKELVELYDSNINYYKLDSYNETEVRTDFINKFFELLGWDVNNKLGLPQNLREVKQEANVSVDENNTYKTKKPDYLFKINKENKFYLEAKKPSVDILNNKSAAYQTKRYGWSGNLNISVLTNFNDLIIYDCSIRPDELDSTNKGVIAKYNYKEYVDKFEEIYILLSKESIINGNFDKNFSNITNSISKNNFDSYFLDQIREWRSLLANDIHLNNCQFSIKKIELIVQKLINKILFLRICEDRNIEKYEQIKSISSFSELKEIFIEADNKYDSGLFTLIDSSIKVSDNVLLTIFKELYYPNSSYDFSVVDTYILGQIYDMFLSEELYLDNNCIKIRTKKEIADANGAVSTPKYIANRIVKETMNIKAKSLSVDELKNIKICDISCGSGVFLISAFENLLDIYVEKMLEKQEEYIGKELIKVNEHYILSYAFKRFVLQNNIFGVDIDFVAVEVAKFGLLLKLIEDEDKESLEYFSKINSAKILPNIDSNIKCGNSLVDFNFKKFIDYSLENIDLLNKVNMFDWESEYFSKFHKKFDIIVGNPPYTRVQKMAEYIPIEYNFYKSELSGYSSINAVAPDKYYLFIEKAFDLIEKNGVVGFIVPNKFLTNTSGKELRRIISSKKALKKLYHFQYNQIFAKRLTYCCILILQQNNNKFDFAFVNDLNNFKYDNNLEEQEFPSSILCENPWNIKDSNSIKKGNYKKLNEVSKIFVGLQTSNDKIYMIKPLKEDEKYIFFKDVSDIERKIERSICRPGINDLQLQKYNKINNNIYFIFPYEFSNNKAKLMSIDELKEMYPFAFDYLNSYKILLQKRSINNMNDCNWFQYGRSQSLNKFNGKEHLVWSVLSKNANFVYDNSSIMFSGGGNGPYYGLELNDDTKESILYFQALLNHDYLSNKVKETASVFNGGYYSYSKQYIENLPIRLINFDNEEEINLYNNIIAKVEMICKIYEKISFEIDDSTKIVYERLLNDEQNNLNSLIDNLYEGE